MAKSKATDTDTDVAEAPKRKRGRPPKPRPVDENGNPIETGGKVIKHPIPMGWELPGEFHAYLAYHGISDTTQQAVYAWTRGANGHTVKTKDKDGNETEKYVEPNGFPCVTHSDGRVIVNRDEAIQWIKDHEEAKRNRIAQARNRELNASTRMISGMCRLTNLLHAASQAEKKTDAVVDSES